MIKHIYNQQVKSNFEAKIEVQIGTLKSSPDKEK